MQVLDSNDSPPTFPAGLYTAHVSEAALSGSTVIDVIAEDPDTTGSAVYSIQSGADGKFNIDATTGKIN